MAGHRADRAGQAAEAPGARVYLFGDLLALARVSWVRRMERAIGEAGYPDYHRSDAALLRLLRAGPVAIGHIGAGLGVTRQAAGKLVDALVARGYAVERRDAGDGRVVQVVLTPAGEAYAAAIVTAVAALNRAFVAHLGLEDLRGADRVLRAAVGDQEPWASLALGVSPP